MVQMTLDDWLNGLDNKPFCFDADINEIASRIRALYKKLGLDFDAGKPAFNVWSHVPNLGYRFELFSSIPYTVYDAVLDGLMEIVDYGKEHSVEVSVVNGFSINKDCTGIMVSTMFTDKRKNRKTEWS